jgi:hypothetical protein
MVIMAKMKIGIILKKLKMAKRTMAYPKYDFDVAHKVGFVTACTL